MEKKRLPRLKAQSNFASIQQFESEDSAQVDISQILDIDHLEVRAGNDNASILEQEREVKMIVIYTKEIGRSSSNRKGELCLLPLLTSEFDIWTKGLGTLIDHYKSQNRNTKGLLTRFSLVESK